jgi:hypothetical protein
MDPIRIFIGCSANNEDLEFQAVLDYTLHKHTTRDLEINWMKLSRNPESFWYSNKDKREGWNTQTWATPFSPFRWAIPYYCNFVGKAIYMDIDMWCQADIGELWDQEFKDGAVVLAKGKNKAFCCSLWDCEKIKPFMPPLDKLRSDVSVYRDLRKHFDGKPGLVQAFKGNWNCLDGEDYVSLHDPDIKVVHCTRIPTQPHIPFANVRLAAKGQKHWFTGTPIKHPRSDLRAMFIMLLNEEVENGYPLDKYETKETFGAYGR